MENLIAGMTWVDWVIVIVIVCAALSGLAQGFFRSFFSVSYTHLDVYKRQPLHRKLTHSFGSLGQRRSR